MILTPETHHTAVIKCTNVGETAARHIKLAIEEPLKNLDIETEFSLDKNAKFLAIFFAEEKEKCTRTNFLNNVENSFKAAKVHLTRLNMYTAYYDMNAAILEKETGTPRTTFDSPSVGTRIQATEFISISQQNDSIVTEDLNLKLLNSQPVQPRNTPGKVNSHRERIKAERSKPYEPYKH